ncbi:MAG: phosphoribosylglycinamide formyltransferase [Gammaproteobacteria bacterium]|nr:MAG: phosphoribosylglycinamide formyltransferase [Gammaproteobacteria bacterium]
MTTRVVVLLSGRGSNLEAILAHVRCGQIPATVVGVISNRPGARGLDIARSAGITAACLDHRPHADRAAFEALLATTIDALEPDLILLAGFMRVLTPAFVERYSPRLLNIHPSLLPEHRGLDTHARALARGDREHGASVHVVVPELDAGPVIAQVVVPIKAEDDVLQLAARVQRGEHLLYPRVLDWYANGRLQLEQTQVILDGTPLPESGARFRLVMADTDNAAAAGDTLEVA